MSGGAAAAPGASASVTARRQRSLGRVVEATGRVDRMVAHVEAAVAIIATAGMVVFVALPMAIRPLRGNQDSARPAVTWLLDTLLPDAAAQSAIAAVFSGDYSWMPQLSRYLLIWATFAGASLATRVRGHIVVDLVTKIAPRRARAVLNVLANALATLLCAALSVVGAYVVWRNWEQATVLRGVDWGKVHVVIPVMLAIMSARFLRLGLEDLDGALSGDLSYLDRHEPDEDEHGGRGGPPGEGTPLPEAYGEPARDAAAAAGAQAGAAGDAAQAEPAQADSTQSDRPRGDADDDSPEEERA